MALHIPGHPDLVSYQIFMISSVIDCILWKSKLFVHISLRKEKNYLQFEFRIIWKTFCSKCKNSSCGIHKAGQKSTRDKFQLHLPIKIDSLLLVLVSIHRKLAFVISGMIKYWRKFESMKKNLILMERSICYNKCTFPFNEW